MIKNLFRFVGENVSGLIIYPGSGQAQNFFSAKMPDDAPDSCACVYQDSALPNLFAPPLEEGMFRFRVRNVSYYSGSEIATDIRQLFVRRGATRLVYSGLDEYELFSVPNVMAPIILPRDEKLRYLFEVIVRLYFEKKG